MSFASFREFETWLDQKGQFHIDLGLTRIRKALAELAPVPPLFRAIQVLGTNGKGSTSAFFAALAKAHGLKAGLYTSPHFVSVRERILVDGAMLDERQWLCAANVLHEKAPELTYFESMTALAVMLFSQCNVDIAIFEAGLGGKYDATSAIPASVQCYTPIGIDHAAIIGPGIADIAADKAFAMRSGSLVFSAQQYPVSTRILEIEASQKEAYLQFTEPLQAGITLGLAGKFQGINAGLALAAWRMTSNTLHLAPTDTERLALETAFIPGRMQEIRLGGKKLILDGAHNPHAIQTLLASLKRMPDLIIYSALADKNWKACLGMLLRTDRKVLIPQLGGSRAANAEEIAAWANRIAPGQAKATKDARTALELFESGSCLLCGSLYLLSEVFKMHPQFLGVFH